MRPDVLVVFDDELAAHDFLRVARRRRRGVDNHSDAVPPFSH